MKSRQHLLFLLILILAIIVFSFLTNDFKSLILSGTRIDTVGHFIGFFLLTWFLNVVIKLSMTELFFALLVYAALTEVGQFYLGFRNGEVSDFIADVIGISLYAFIKWLIVVYGKQQKI